MGCSHSNATLHVVPLLVRALVAVTASVSVGLAAGAAYGRLVMREYEVVARIVAEIRGWAIAGMSLVPDGVSGGWQIRLAGAVGALAVDASAPSGAYVVSQWSLGGVLGSPIAIGAILLAWPAVSWRVRLVRLALGLAGLSLIEAVGIGLALLAPFAETEAIMRGAATPTLLEIWARVLQAGGGVVLAGTAALVIIAMTRRQIRPVFACKVVFHSGQEEYCRHRGAIREQAMSMNIRFKVVGGREGEDLRPSEEDARAALARTLAEYEKRGHRIRNVGNEYIVEDHGGDTVATYELLS